MGKFEYDEEGSSFFTFIVSIYCIVLVPLTYYLAKKIRSLLFYKTGAPTNQANSCLCDPCANKKDMMEHFAYATFAKDRTKSLLYIFLLVLAYSFFFMFVYSLVYSGSDGLTQNLNNKNFDPFEVLGVEPSATEYQIKKAFRRLSVKFHPDRGGRTEDFLAIQQAHHILTDETARYNWEHYGNANGPRVLGYGIALPAWMIRQGNQKFLLFLYVAVFLLAVPGGIYAFYRYFISNAPDYEPHEKTRQMFFQLVMKSPDLSFKHALSVISCSVEFTDEFDRRFKIKDSDEALFKKLCVMLNTVKNSSKESHFSDFQTQRARNLLLAHLMRKSLPVEYQKLQHTVLLIMPKLLSCLVKNVIWGIFAAPHYNLRPCKVEAFENCVRLCAGIVQAVNFGESALLQIPYITMSDVKRILSKKKNVHSVLDFAKLSVKNRAVLFEDLDSTQMCHVNLFFKDFPAIFVKAAAVCSDEESDSKHHITTNTIISVDFVMRRVVTEQLLNNEVATNTNVVNNLRAQGKKGKRSPSPTPTPILPTTRDVEREQIFSEMNFGRDVFNKNFPVHAPHYPNSKNEGWWVYMLDANNENSMLIEPRYVSALNEEGVFSCVFPIKIISTVSEQHWKVRVMSDSYVNVSDEVDVFFTVNQFEEVDIGKQYEFSDSEQEVHSDELTDDE